MMANRKHILIVGDGGVGKTCLINRNFSDYFERRYVPTQNINRRCCDEYIIYDFPGQEKHGSHNTNLQDVKVCIIIYDVTSVISYNNVKFWKTKVEKLCGNIPIIVVGNKIDLTSRKITDSSTVNISVKKQQNIRDLFKSIDDHFTSLTLEEN